MATVTLKYELTCPICLDIYTCPVMLGCGHTFCRECIEKLLEIQTERGNDSCPECRRTCSSEDLQRVNFNLGNIAEYYKSMQDCPSSGKVPCTYCILSPGTAVKTCLHCEASFCKKHLEVHSKNKEHVVVEATTSLQHRKCHLHCEVYKYFCIKDQICICTSCTLVGEHRDHPLELLEEACQGRKEQLNKVLESLNLERQLCEGRRAILRKSLEEKKQQVERLREGSEAMFDGFREHIVDSHVQVMNEVGHQLGQISKQVFRELMSVKERAAELCQDLARVHTVRNTTDPLSVLQDKVCSSIYERWFTMDPDVDHKAASLAWDIDYLLIFLVLHKNIEGVLEHLPLFLSRTLLYLKYNVNFILNKATASRYVTLSPDLKTVTYYKTKRAGESRPEQFKPSQVLSITSFSSGKHFWEVETSKTGVKGLGVAYSTIDRCGVKAFLGYNEKSWCLIWSQNHIEIRHNSDCKQVLSSDVPIYAVGVFLDYEAGLLSFYRLCAQVELLYTITARFTEPLHAAFYVVDSWIMVNPTRST